MGLCHRHFLLWARCLRATQTGGEAGVQDHQIGNGLRQFLLRGLENVQNEWTLVCLAWNLKHDRIAPAAGESCVFCEKLRTYP